MSGNRSLDEFADAGQAEGADGRPSGEGAAAETTVEEPAAEEQAAAGQATEERADAETADEAASDGEEVVPDGPEDAEEPADATLDSVPEDSESAEVEDDDGRVALDPPASTYVWHPGGGECADCGATVEERWRDGDDFVCAGCKEW